MKYKGKIIQIIEEKKAKEYVLSWQQDVLPNYDYLNIRPAEEREVPKKYRWNWGISMILCMVAMVLLRNSFMPFIFFALLIGIFFLGRNFIEKYQNKFVPKGWHYHDAFPVEKPHNYKVGDLVDVELNLNYRRKI